MNTLGKEITEICSNAKTASRQLVSLSSELKNKCLLRMANLLLERKDIIQKENAIDLENARKKGLSDAMLDRLELSDKVIDSVISGIEQVVSLPDPIGNISSMIKRPNGLMVGRMAIPLGVIGMIYESRPNVTVDAAVLCLKTSNSIILRGGSEAINSNKALTLVLQEALRECGINENAIQVIPTSDRDAVSVLLQQVEYLDLIIPRGGEGLIRYVAENSRIPVLKHYKGVCHIFIDKDADHQKAKDIVVNSKAQRPGVCNALEGVLIHEKVADSLLPELVKVLKKENVILYGCEKSVEIDTQINPANQDHWGTEFLDLSLCVKIVNGYEEAKQYIEKYGSQHTECIITENYSLAQRFIKEIDASSVMINAATRFNDGGELGLGTEIGISTTKLHAYGPMGLKELTSKKFIVYGDGQVRK